MESIGRYRITSRIGAGAFATVYKAHDDQLDVPVAVKVLSEAWAADEDVRSRFLAEARLLRRIQDERIVRVYDVGTTDGGRPYFVMDYADGGTLESLRGNLVEPGRALRLVAEAARGLEVLHREGIVHRDVTPGNILLAHTPHGVRVMLADLGVASRIIGEGDAMTAGTPAYMAPEQATGRGVDQRSDVYSIASVAYALLVGRPPFDVRSLDEVIARDLAIGPSPVSALVGAPPALDSLLTRALSPEPDLRPQRAVDLATALDQVADVLPGGQSHSPRPLAPAAGQSPTTSAGIPQAVPAASAPMVHPNETPASMLQNYLGPGRYEVARPVERHPASWYAFVGVALLALTVLVALLTKGWLES